MPEIKNGELTLLNFKKLVKFLNSGELDASQDEQYVRDTILAGFSRLPAGEQVRIITSGVGVEIKIEAPATPAPVESELSVIERENGLELIRLRSWLVKTIILCIIAGIIVFIMLGILFNGKMGFEAFSGMIETFMKVVKVIIG